MLAFARCSFWYLDFLKNQNNSNNECASIIWFTAVFLRRQPRILVPVFFYRFLTHFLAKVGQLYVARLLATKIYRERHVERFNYNWPSFVQRFECSARWQLSEQQSMLRHGAACYRIRVNSLIGSRGKETCPNRIWELLHERYWS